MSSKIQIALNSPSFWFGAAAFAVAAITAILPQLHGTIALLAVGVLAGLSTILHPGEVQQAGNTRVQ